MTDDTLAELNRRQFFRAAGRAAALGALAVLSAVLLRRRGAGDCNLPACDRCAELAGCELPRARTARREDRRP